MTLAVNFLFMIPKSHEDIRDASYKDDPGMSKMRRKVKPESQYLFLVPRILQFSARAYLLKLNTQANSSAGSGNLHVITRGSTVA
jgi:hypothetical protein